MAIKLADVFVNITAKTDEYDRAEKQVRDKSNALGNILQGVAQGVGQALFRAAADGFSSLVSGIDQSIDRASDLNESINKTGAVFGAAAQDVVDWSQTTSSALGQSQQQALEAAAGFGNLLTSLGFARGEAAETSRGLVELASDLASFNNIDPTIALEKLRAGLIGETEPLRTLGVNLSAAAVEAKAMELGLADSTKALTEQDKATARLAIIYQQTISAQGDFARTAEGTANASRRVAAGFENLSTTIGAAFEPIKGVILNGLADIIEAVQPYAENIVAQIANGLAAGLTYILPVLQTLRSIFTYWLQPGSPPRLLPELVKWGKSAAEQFLLGWAEADFNSLDELGSSIEGVLRSFASTGQIKEIDLVGRIFGTRDAIARAISEFRELGRVSQDSLNDIAQAAGPAGAEVTGVVRAYFELEKATRATAAAQDDLNAVNERFAGIIDPIQGQLDTLREQEREIRNQQQRERLQANLRDPAATAREKDLIRIQLQQLELENQLIVANREKATAVGDAEDNLAKVQENEAQAQENLNVQESILDQRVKENNLISEQTRLQDRLADATARAADAAARAADAANSKAQREMEAALRDSEREAQRLADAQLRYQLQVADLPGKIAIMRGELAKTTEGSVEYFEILTQISSLEQQLANQRTKGGAGALGLPEIAPIELPELDPNFGENLTQSLDGLKKAAELAFGVFTGEGETIAPPAWLVSAKEAIDNLILGIGEMNETFDKTFNNERFTSLQTEVTEFLQFINENWLKTNEDIGDDTESFWENQGAQAATNTEELLLLTELFLNAMQGDWAEAWQNIKDISKIEMDANEENQGSWLSNLLGNFGTFYDDAIKGIAQWLLDTTKAFNEWFAEKETDFNEWLTGVYDSFVDFDLAGAGKAMLDSFWTGLKSKWGDISTWFGGKLQGIRDMLPGSEPKDASSPLRGLPATGAALIGQIQKGIDAASLNVGSFAAAGLQPAAAVTNATNTNSTVVNVYLSGEGATYDAGRSVGRGVMDELRQSGLK